MNKLSDCALDKRCVEIHGNDFRDMCGPGVYLYLLGDIALYVGMAKSVIQRAARWDHEQADKARLLCDRVILIPARSLERARKMENILIADLQPKYNLNKKNGACKLVDVGVWPKSVASRIAKIFEYTKRTKKGANENENGCSTSSGATNTLANAER